jgi:hypothetical protein
VHSSISKIVSRNDVGKALNGNSCMTIPPENVVLIIEN